MNSADQFNAMITAQYEPLFRFAMSLTRSQSDAEDLTQQTFCTWAEKGHQLRDASKAKTWLFTTLHRGFLSMRRRQLHFPHEELASAPLPPVVPEFGKGTDSATILAALARVDSVYQAAVSLFYLEDYTYNDIASILELPVGTVKSRISRGIGQLREIVLTEGICQPLPDPPAGDQLPAKYNTAAQRCDTPRATGRSEPRYAEWDLSSTVLLELTGSI